jgi:hypothetical protein
MPISISCPSCGRQNIADKLPVGEARYGLCQTTFVVPVPIAQTAPPLALGAGPEIDTRNNRLFGEAMKRALVVNLARAAVWLIVVLWCMVPIAWWLFTLVRTIGVANPAPPRFGPMGPGPDAGLMVSLLGSVVMLAMFFYGCWCAVGVVCGFGLDRTVYTADHLYGAFFPGKDRPTNWGGDDKE